MKKPAIPTIPNDPVRKDFDAALKENIEIIAGKRRGSKVQSLTENATLADVIAKLNEILAVVQG